MGKLLRRMWRYMTTSLSKRFEEHADPEVQLQQAIDEAQEQHRLLRERAADVIANQKQTEMQLERATANLDKTLASAKQALVMAEEASAAGDTDRAGRLTQAAESFANRLVILEDEVATLEALLLQASESSDKAKEAVRRNSAQLEKLVTERQALLNQLGQAEMAEQMNDSMEAINASIGSDVPTLGEVRSKIEGRLARAQGHAALNADSAESQMLEVEHAAMNSQAQAQLSRLRSELGLEGESADAVAEAARRDEIEAEIDAAITSSAGPAEPQARDDDEPAGEVAESAG